MNETVGLSIENLQKRGNLTVEGQLEKLVDIFYRRLEEIFSHEDSQNSLTFYINFWSLTNIHVDIAFHVKIITQEGDDSAEITKKNLFLWGIRWKI